MIEKEGMRDRISVRQGDWTTDSFGNDNDVVLFSNVLHGPGSDAEMKLGKAYDSMDGSGLLVVQEFLLNDLKTGPLAAALFNVMVGAFSKDEIFSVIAKSGFREPKLAAESEETGSSWITAEKS